LRVAWTPTASPYVVPLAFSHIVANECPQIHNTFLERQLRGLYTLEKHISSRTFFVGERITLADIYIATMVLKACNSNIDTPTRAKIPNLMRHLETIINQPALANVFPPLKELEKAPVYVAPKKEKEGK
jgi:elongation factor 1-gamma